MYFWVPKHLEISFLFDLFLVPIPGLTLYPRACIVLHVSLIGGHRQIGACFRNLSDHRDHPGTLGLAQVVHLTSSVARTFWLLKLKILPLIQ